MTKNITWFDAFFSALTSSPEFKYVMDKDYNKDLLNWVESMKKWIWTAWEKLNQSHENLKKSQENVSKWSSIFDQLQWQFSTQEAFESAEKYNWNSLNKTESKISLNVEYFDKKNPDTWWFLWIAGMDDLKKELNHNFINPLKFKFFIEKLKSNNSDISDKKSQIFIDLYSKYEEFWVSIPSWLMLYWPPWTWKTFITKKLAEELNCWLIRKSVWEFWSSYIHQTAKNIRDFFQQAKKLSETQPLILFLDEIDSLVSKRTDKVDSNKAEEISQFLQEINDLKKSPNLILIWATNRPDHLDSAIMRSWRFDKKIYIWPPDFQARKELFKIFIEKQKKPHDILDYDELSRLTNWYVSADIEAICAEASRDASKSILDIMQSLQKDFENHDLESINNDINKNLINMDLLRQAITDTVSSLKLVDISIYDNWLKSLE